MMKTSTIQDLLKNINYIEADIEIQKQILFSIPSGEKEEMEKTIKIIADKKKAIKRLRAQIQDIDPEEFKRITVFEQAIETFKKLALEKTFESILARSVGEQCSLALVDGNNIECLIKACDKRGDWTIITLDGEIQQFSQAEVKEKPHPSTEPN
jgi:biotin-(acetyl-CoA carboxylase) ligase